MKKLYFLYPILLFFVVFGAKDVLAGTCTSISRTNNSANAVLTSTKYNLDLNTVYTAVNALDGGCVTDGTLEKAAVNTTDFSVPLNGIKEGCKVTYNNASSIDVDKCRIAVNGNWITTTGLTNVAFGCSGCSAETTNTAYYVYAKTGSTLDLLISTTAPDSNGYSGTSKVLGRFYNDPAGDIATDNIEQFVTNSLLPITQKVAIVQDSRASGVQGDSLSSLSTWNTVTLNTELLDSAGILSLASNTVTLNPGTYLVHAFTLYNNDNVTGQAKLRLRNTTTNVTTISGVNHYAGAASVGSQVVLDGYVSISTVQNFQLQIYYTKNATANTSMSTGEREVYTQLEFTRIN